MAGAVLILSSVPAGLTSLDPAVFSDGTDIVSAITDKIILGQFVAGALPILWVGIGVVLAGHLLGNVVGGGSPQTRDILRLAVLGSLYPIVYQFTNIVLYDETSFSLIPPLLAGLAATLMIAAILFWRSRKQKGGVEKGDQGSHDARPESPRG